MPRPKPAPADRRQWLLFCSVWLLVGLVFLGVGLAIGYSERLAANARMAPAAHTQGTVLVKSYNPDAAPPKHHVDYRFFTSTGRKIYGSAVVSPQAWDSQHELQPLTVFYSALDPDRNWIEGTTSSYLLFYIFGGLGAVFTALGAILLLKTRGRP